MVPINKYKKEPELRGKLLELLKLVDRDFVPPLSQRESLANWMNLFDRGIVLYAEEGGNVAGFLACYPSLNNGTLNKLRSCVNIKPVISSMNHDENFKGAYLHFIAVSPAYRKKKISDALLAALLKNLQERGISRIRVVTWSTNKPSLRLYLRHKFHVFHLLPDDRGKGVDSIYLEAEIPPEEPL